MAVDFTKLRPQARARLPEQYERIELLRETPTREGPPMPAGSRGTVVDVMGDHEAFLVEFLEPFWALITLRPSVLRYVAE